ncbi:MAG: cytochrome-c peroxidase [Gammaproteobacteria bacterium]|nr:cytochrome-c peroxidase [Gammaproteobacteria bacterium]MDH5652897.1 cytochrome-c peroxidase [Gammaproteobacteria bacterium]
MVCSGILAMVLTTVVQAATPVGLPAVPVPKNNPQSPDKIKLGEKLFLDKRFSADGTVSCSTCHDPARAFTDSPLKVSEGIKKLTGTRNAPTVVNAAYMEKQFWDGREPDLEGQSAGPFINPVEMGLKNHEPILQIVRSDPEYQKLFKKVFKASGKQITMKHVQQAIASFERTVISGNSPFDRFYFTGDKSALNEKEQRGLQVFLGQGRCVSCHTISQTHALFTDSRFHNLGVGFDRINKDVKELANAYQAARKKGIDVDVEVLTNKNTSELGRFAVSTQLRDLGGFKTPTLRNVAVTGPYMHDGSMETLRDVVVFYNNGGRVKESDPFFDFQSGGIRPLDLSDDQIDDLVAFLEALTSPEHKK